MLNSVFGLMVMGVFAEIMNGFECFCKCNIFVPDLGEEKLCSVLVFGNVCFNIVVRINHDNVASRGAVGHTHTIVRLQSKRWNGEFWGFRICMGFGLAVPPLPHIVVFRVCLYNGLLCCGFLCARLISVSFPATTPRATTPVQIHSS